MHTSSKAITTSRSIREFLIDRIKTTSLTEVKYTSKDNSGSNINIAMKF